MKNTLLILIGIIIGIGSSFLLPADTAPQPSTPQSKEIAKVPEMTIWNDLRIIDTGWNYCVSLINDTNLFVTIQPTKDRKSTSDIGISDRREHQDFTFKDTDSNGTLDFWSYIKDDAMFTYGRGNGYPDAELTEANQLIVRIDDRYFTTQEIDGKKFIEQDGNLVEIEHTGNFCYTIKK